MIKVLRKLVVTCYLVFAFSSAIGYTNIGGAKEYKVGGNCPDPYSVTSSDIVTRWPLDNFILTQKYWWSHPADDLSAPFWTPIYASGSGFVEESYFMRKGYGWYVIINHGSGLKTLYGHMVQQPEVLKGDLVLANDIIGYVGSTGKSSGPHVHFEILKDECNIDPYTVLSGE